MIFPLSINQPTNFSPSSQGQGTAGKETSIVQVPPTEAQLTARSKLRELKAQVEQRLRAATSKAPEFVTLYHSPVTTDSFSNYAARQAKREQEINQGATYLNRLIEVAYPTQNDASTYTQKITGIKTRFQTYLDSHKESQEEGSTSKSVNQISAKALHDVLRDLHLARLEEELRVARENHEPWVLTPEERNFFSNQLNSTKDRPLPERYQVPYFLENLELMPKSFFEKQKMSLTLHETGGFAGGYIVGSREAKFSNDKYFLKWIKQKVSQDPHTDFWRQQEFALAQLNGTSNIVRTLFFMVGVTVPDQGTKHYLLPADELKIFGLHLPAGAEVMLEGQLMEQAPGMSLYHLTKRGGPGLSLEDVKKIARGLFAALRTLHTHNLLHGDFNLGNIFYDPVSGKVTLLDFGFAQRFRKREKEEDRRFHNNPLAGNTTSKREDLKSNFRSPRTSKTLHGSEVDFFSYAVILLWALNPTEFNAASYRKQCDRQALRFSGVHPLENYLEVAQEWDGSHSTYLPSKTKETLDENPKLKKTIELAFRISEGGEDGAKAFEELKGMF